MKNFVWLLCLCFFSSSIAFANHQGGRTEHRTGGGGGGAPTPQHPGGGGPSGGGGGSLGPGGADPASAEQKKMWREAWEKKQRELKEAQVKQALEAQQKRLEARPFHQKEASQLAPQLYQQIGNDLTRLDQLKDHFDLGGYSFVRNQLKWSGSVVEMITVHPSFTVAKTGKLLFEYAVHSANAMNEFLSGVSNGVVKGFENQLITAQQVAQALWDNPKMVQELAANIPHAIMQAPEHLTEHLKTMYQDFVLIMEYGTPYDVGFAAGNFISNTMTTLAALEAPGVQVALEAIRNGAIRSSQRGWIANHIALDLKRHTGFDAWDHLKKMDQAEQGALRGWSSKYQVLGFEKAEDVNSRILANEQLKGSRNSQFAPYWPGTRVVHFQTRDVTHFVRVHGPENQVGDWLMRKDAIDGLTAREIQIKYSLRHPPTHLSYVDVPVGTSMTRGTVNDILNPITRGEIDAHTPFGVMQYHTETPLTAADFKNMRELQ